MSGRKLSLTVSTIATMGFLLFGYDQGVMSGIISATAFNDIFTATKKNDTMQALVTAVYELGCLFGAIWALFMGDRMGRRWMIIAGATVMIIGVIIQVTAFTGHVPLAQFIIGRIITGVGNGMNTSTIPTYQAECSRTSNRGLLICIEGGIIAIGTAIAYWIDFGASYGPDDLVWRFPIAFQIVFGIIIIVGMWFLPDSPRYLISKGKVHEGEYVLAALGGFEIDSHETQLQKQLVIESIEAYVFFPSLLVFRANFSLVLVSLRVLATRICSLVARLSTCAVCLSVLRPRLLSSCLVAMLSSTISLCCSSSLSIRVGSWLWLSVVST
jgi:MFS family permease